MCYYTVGRIWEKKCSDFLEEMSCYTVGRTWERNCNDLLDEILLYEYLPGEKMHKQ